MSCKVIAIEQKKEDTGKSTTAVNLGVALKMKSEEALLIEGDPQGCVPACTSAEGRSTDRAGRRDSFSISLGNKATDELDVSLATLTSRVFDNKTFDDDYGVINSNNVKGDSYTCGRANDFIAFSRDEIFLITEKCCITPTMRRNSCV